MNSREMMDGTAVLDGGAARPRLPTIKVKTNTLTRRALNWAVAICEGYVVPGVDDEPWAPGDEPFDFCGEWAQGGPIVDREHIGLSPPTRRSPIPKDYWTASTHWQVNHYVQAGATALEAAMRCYVAWKLGDEVEIPGEMV